MSFYGKFFFKSLFMLFVGAQLQAQWGPLDGSQANSSPGSSGCRDIVLTVINPTGMGIAGANAILEDNGFPFTTDSRGFVDIPCSSFAGRWPVAIVSAAGYRSARVTLEPGVQSRLEVRLDAIEPVVRPARATIGASELLPNVQKQSVQLQEEARRAMAVSDYDGAEKFLMEALQLTPSAAAIANNLGVVALHRKEVNTAASWFEQASKEAPFSWGILGNLGLVRWMQGRIEESYEILMKAFSGGYESPLGNYVLGTLKLERGESKEAAHHLKKIPADRFPFRNLFLSIALRNCGKSKEADETYRSFIRNNPAPFLISILR